MIALDLVKGDQIDTAEAATFLRKVFTDVKSKFIIEHGRWLYRGSENQWFMLLENEIVGYCAVIPVDCALQGERIQALWYCAEERSTTVW